MLNSWSLIDCHVELVCTLHAGPGNAERSAVLWFSICPILTSEHNVFIIENISCRFYFMTALVFSSRFCHTSTHTHTQTKSDKMKVKKTTTYTRETVTAETIASEHFCIFVYFIVFSSIQYISLFSRRDAIRLLG